MILVFGAEMLANRDALALRKSCFRFLVLRVGWLTFVCCCLRLIYYMVGDGHSAGGVYNSENELAAGCFCDMMLVDYTGYVYGNALFGVVGKFVDVMNGSAVRVKFVLAWII